MGKIKALAVAGALTAALSVALGASSAQAVGAGVTTTRTYVAGADVVTVTWYENGVFTLAKRIAINGPQAVTVDRYASTYCTTVQRGPGGQPPIVWAPVNGYRTQCDPYVNINGVKMYPPSHDVVSTPEPTDSPTYYPFP